MCLFWLIVFCFFTDIVDDVREECNKYGITRSLEIPRPIEGMDVPGCGKVIVIIMVVFMKCISKFDDNAFDIVLS